MQKVIEMLRLGTKGPNIGKEDVKHSAAASAFDPRKLLPNLDRTAEQDDDDRYDMMWCPTD